MDDSAPLLSASEEIDLARTIEAGLLARAVLDGEPGTQSIRHRAGVDELEDLARLGELAWERFLLANARLVGLHANREAARLRLPADELFQEGWLGLLEALRRWDYTKGARFATYALVWIRNTVSIATATRCGELHVTARQGARLRLARALQHAGEERGEAAPIESIAGACGRSARWTEHALAYRAPVGLAAAGEGVGADREGELDDAPTGAEVVALVAVLPEPGRSVVRLRFGIGDGEPRSRTAVGRLLGMSATSVARIEERALASLRASVEREPDYAA